VLDAVAAREARMWSTEEEEDSEEGWGEVV